MLCHMRKENMVIRSGEEHCSLPGNSFPGIPCATTSTLPWYFLGYSRLAHSYRGQVLQLNCKIFTTGWMPSFLVDSDQDLFDRK